MIRFEDEVQRIVVEEGIASERTNKALEDALIGVYLMGFFDCHNCNSQGVQYSPTEVQKQVTRTRESYEV